MHTSLVWFAVVSILFQYIQGTIHHFSAKRLLHHRLENDDLIYQFEKHATDILFSESDDGIAVADELPKLLRPTRQETGGSPKAYSSKLIMDDRRFGILIYSGEGSKVIYLLTFTLESGTLEHRVTSSALYRSTDYGYTFVDESSSLPVGSVLHDTVYRFPNSKTVMFADTSRSKIYVTTDEGETFRSYNIPVDPRTLKIHPTMPGWILGHANSHYGGVLKYSENYGSSWATVAQLRRSLFDYFTWGEPGIDWNIDNPSQSNITKVYYSATDLTSSAKNRKTLYVAYKSDDGYVNKVFDLKLAGMFGFIIDGGYIYAAQSISGGQLELHVSYMRKSFNLVQIPTTFPRFSTIVASHPRSRQCIIIDHSHQFSVYVSDENGTSYSLSLENIAVQINNSSNYFTIDLKVINSMNGTMMANQYIYVGGKRRNRTLITFDNGASWHSIAAPANINDVPSNCTLPTCSLHFHMDSSMKYKHLGVHSRDSAPGIIIAHGNIGPYLTNNSSVFISRDGGLTWEQTLDSSWHVEIIDHGGLLVAAKDNHQDYSRTIKYSCDEGMSWKEFKFSNVSLLVWEMRTEPGGTTTQVLLFCAHSRLLGASWLITHVNFTSVFPRTCEASDYYQWTVLDGRIGGQQCLLGETRVIERRKPSVCCWNSRQYERLISATPCLCTAADFECDYGYERDNHSGNCTVNSQYITKSNCSTGYHKIPGDKCYGGVSSQYLRPSNCSVDVRPVQSSGSNSGNSNSGNNSRNNSGNNNENNNNNGNNNSGNNNENNNNNGNNNSGNNNENKNNNSGNNSGKNSGRSYDNSHNNTVVIVSLSVMIPFAVILLIAIGIRYYLKKWIKKIKSTRVTDNTTEEENVNEEPVVFVKMSDEQITIRSISCEKLIED